MCRGSWETPIRPTRRWPLYSPVISPNNLINLLLSMKRSYIFSLKPHYFYLNISNIKCWLRIHDQIVNNRRGENKTMGLWYTYIILCFLIKYFVVSPTQVAPGGGDMKIGGHTLLSLISVKITKIRFRWEKCQIYIFFINVFTYAGYPPLPLAL